MFLPRPRKPEGSLEERAVRWIIVHHDMTYAQVAAMFGVTENNIRSRIEYRYGSLAYARHYGLEDGPPNASDNTCFICRKSDTLEPGTYICDDCKRESL